jgi:hypothetical protein
MRSAVLIAIALALALTADVQAQPKSTGKAPSNLNAVDPDVIETTAWVGVAALALIIWMLPIIIAGVRCHPDGWAITAVCVLFGCTFLGWGIALIWSLTGIRKPTVIVINQNSPNDSPPIVDPKRNPFDFS